ncbi:MAG: glycosyltransferase family 2 protein [Planctomycetota bacterium]
MSEVSRRRVRGGELLNTLGPEGTSMLEPVTVTVVNFNGSHYIVDCLEAIGSLEPAPFETIVVDNASEDGSADLVASRFPEVRLIRLPANEGPCPARNRGLEEARTRLVFQLDGDVIVAPDCLERLLKAFLSGPDVVVAQPRALFDDDRERIHYDGAHFHYVGLMTLRHFYGRLAEADTGAVEVDAGISLALLVDREVVLRAGGYDPAFFILFEDHDLCYRLRARGHRILVVTDALVYHRQGTAGISYRQGPHYPRQRAWLHARNRWLILAKNHRLSTLLLTAPGLVLFDAAWLLFSLRRGLAVPYLRGKWCFFKLLPHVWRERRRFARARLLGDRALLDARPLTITPLIGRSSLLARAERALNALLDFWWRVVRAFVR